MEEWMDMWMGEITVDGLNGQGEISGWVGELE